MRSPLARHFSAVAWYIVCAGTSLAATAARFLGPPGQARTERPAPPVPSAARPPALAARVGGGESAATRAPAISLVMAAFDALRHDPRHLDSALQSAVDQTLPVAELIVVDDGSTDGTAQAVREFGEGHPELKLSILRQENRGQSSARNLGAAHARSEWLAFLDQDDEWKRDRLAAVLPYLTPEADLVYTDADVIDEHGTVVARNIHRDHRRRGPHPRATLRDVLVRDACAMPGVVTVRKDFFESLGGFDERLSGYEDDDFFTRAYVAGRVRYVPVSTLRWRQYRDSYSWSPRMGQSRLYYWQKLIAAFAANDPVLAQDISLRFFRDFIVYSYMMRTAGDPGADAELAMGLRLVPHLPPVDRFVFGLVRWSCTRTSRPARFVFYWFVRGSDRHA
jgi:glycosyltransferase involved in cell wall biosynthesis